MNSGIRVINKWMSGLRRYSLEYDINIHPVYFFYESTKSSSFK